jgi:prephenate dehydrogenase
MSSDDDFPDIRSAAVIGLGLMGGSLARDLAAHGVRVLGWDADAETLRAAVAAGVVHQPLDADLRGAGKADAVVLAVPVLAARTVLPALAPHLANVRLVTDLGSTKGWIVEAAQALGIGARFVGSHPLVGDHRSGWNASRRGLFEGARVYLSRARSTEARTVRLASRLWTALGGAPELIDADLHDVRLAWTSHLPQIVSTALALTIHQTGTQREQLGPGGRDVTRLAGSDPTLWADVLIDNADALASALAMFSAQLAGLSRAILNEDHANLLRDFATARDWHRQGFDDG